MGKTIEATKVVHENLAFALDKDGDITALRAHVNVSYAGERPVGVRYEDDIWPLLTQGQQNAMQAFHDKLMQFLHDKYLA